MSESSNCPTSAAAFGGVSQMSATITHAEWQLTALLCSQTHTIITTTNFRTFWSSQKESQCSWSPPPPDSPGPPVSGNHSPAFYSYRSRATPDISYNCHHTMSDPLTGLSLSTKLWKFNHVIMSASIQCIFMEKWKYSFISWHLGCSPLFGN